MKRKDIIYLAISAVLAGIISFFISSIVFKVPLKRTGSVPVAQPISSTFPDVKTDSAYNSFLNTKALDPTQPIQIGAGTNTKPFNETR